MKEIIYDSFADHYGWETGVKELHQNKSTVRDPVY
jgi:hypothetical protein